MLKTLAGWFLKILPFKGALTVLSILGGFLSWAVGPDGIVNLLPAHWSHLLVVIAAFFASLGLTRKVAEAVPPAPDLPGTVASPSASVASSPIYHGGKP